MTETNGLGVDGRKFYRSRIAPLVKRAPWVLRVTDLKGKPSPVFVVKAREPIVSPNDNVDLEVTRTRLRDKGWLYGEALRRTLPVVRQIVGEVRDHDDIPLELQRFLPMSRIVFRGNLPVDEEAGTKLALIFKLQERIQQMNRVELIAWRVFHFTREEAEYWYTRVTQYGRAGNRWAISGMRTMLGGQPGDPDVEKMLDELRR